MCFSKTAVMLVRAQFQTVGFLGYSNLQRDGGCNSSIDDHRHHLLKGGGSIMVVILKASRRSIMMMMMAF